MWGNFASKQQHCKVKTPLIMYTKKTMEQNHVLIFAGKLVLYLYKDKSILDSLNALKVVTGLNVVQFSV